MNLEIMVKGKQLTEQHFILLAFSWKDRGKQKLSVRIIICWTEIQT
jgi:hypothetical protein